MSSNIHEALQNARPHVPDQEVLQSFTDRGGIDADDQLYCTHEHRMVSVGEWGEQLPQGVVVEDAVRRDFELRPQTMRVDLEIQRVLQGGNLKNHRGRYLSALAALSCEHIAGRKLGTASNKSISFVEQLASTDLTYILMTRGFRRNNNRLPLTFDSSFKCPTCGNPLREGLQCSADAVQVHVFDWTPESRPTSAVLLSQPFVVSEETTIDAVAVQTVSWGHGVGGARSEQEMMQPAWVHQQILGSAIVGYRTVDGVTHEGALPMGSLLDLPSFDVEGIMKAVNRTSGDVFPLAMGRHDCGETIPVPFDLVALVMRQ